MNDQIYSLTEVRELLQAVNPGPRPSEVIVFVHGIYSSHKTFETLAKDLRQNGIGADFLFAYFDYDFKKEIPTNGKRLAIELEGIFANEDIRVTLVCHSMGGLVGRLALLQNGPTMNFVKRLVMLATPNHGTLHTGRLALLAHITRETTGVLWAFSNRHIGIKQLTEVDEWLRPFLTTGEAKTYNVDYVTIPALFYHENTGLFRRRDRGQSAGLKVLNLGFELTKALPFWTTGLGKPHDGIVEESSVYLGARVPGRESERLGTCQCRPNCGGYVHVFHNQEHKEVDHVTVQSSETTALILADILKFPTLADWRNRTQLAGCSFEPPV